MSDRSGGTTLSNRIGDQWYLRALLLTQPGILNSGHTGSIKVSEETADRIKATLPHAPYSPVLENE